ncbi:MAG: MBL fold metallo-hydrolase [Nanoarchaeota archaeon]|nr:MBL fold metallo-hydrolase [Nanoarchaeota archaeon]
MKYYWNKVKNIGTITLSTILMCGISCTLRPSISAIIENEKSLIVHYINVGNADAHFVETPNKKTILIDGGRDRNGKKIVSYIKNLGYEKIDWVIATHPHKDHIGGLDYIMQRLDVERVFDNGVNYNSKQYREYILCANKNNREVIKRDTTIILDDEVETRFIVPYDNKEGYNKKTNDNSIVLRIQYKDASFLFLSDLEKEGEKDLLEDGKIDEKLDIDVLKIGHHGGKGSTKKELLKATSPKIAIIPTRKWKKNSSPNKEVLDRLENIGDISYYRTDLDGTIILKTNGQKYAVLTEQSLLEKISSILIKIKNKP